MNHQQYPKFNRRMGVSQAVLVLLIMVSVLLSIACADKTDTTSRQGAIPNVLNPESVPSFVGENDGNYYDVIDSEIGEIMSYNITDGNLYLANIKILQEFGMRNEGSVQLKSGVLHFSMTKATGSLTGAVDGPMVVFEVDLESEKVLHMSSEPAPDYSAANLDEFSQHDDEIIVLEDQRAVQIAKYFNAVLGIFEDLVNMSMPG